MDINQNLQCIRNWQQRNHYGRFCEPQEWTVTIPRALEILLRWELGFGGMVTTVSPTSITVVTDVFGGCVDTVVLSGSERDMVPLLQAVYFWAQATTDHFRELVMDRVLDALPQERGGGYLPFYVANLGPILYGENLVRIGMLLALGVGEADMERCLALRLDDIRPAMELAAESGTPLPELLTQLGI